MYCKYCGNKLDNDSKFCNKCGKSVNDNNSNIQDINELGKGKAIASMIIGIISVLFGVLFIPLPIIGLVVGTSYKGKCTEKTVGIILNTIGLIASLVALIFTIIFGMILGFSILYGDLGDRLYENIEVEDIGEWDTYSSYVIDGDVFDNSVSITGNWKELSINRGYLIFKENEYYIYDDINNMEDNYQMGTYVLTTDEKMYGNNKIVKKILTNIFERLNDQNFYIIELHPTKIVKNGLDASTDIDEEERYRALYISSNFMNDDTVIELTMSGFEESELKHYYKVIE